MSAGNGEVQKGQRWSASTDKDGVCTQVQQPVAYLKWANVSESAYLQCARDMSTITRISYANRMLVSDWGPS